MRAFRFARLRRSRRGLCGARCGQGTGSGMVAAATDGTATRPGGSGSLGDIGPLGAEESLHPVRSRPAVSGALHPVPLPRQTMHLGPPARPLHLSPSTSAPPPRPLHLSHCTAAPAPRPPRPAHDARPCNPVRDPSASRASSCCHFSVLVTTTDARMMGGWPHVSRALRRVGQDCGGRSGRRSAGLRRAQRNANGPNPHRGPGRSR